MPIKKLVLSGGGIKGLALIGGLKALEDYKIIYSIDEFVGSSAGALLSYLIVIGYNSDELIEILTNLDLEWLRDITSDTIINFLKTFGIDTGNKIIKIMEIFTIKRDYNKDITFTDLFSLTGKILTITGTNLNKCCTEFFNYKNNPDMKVLDALRISMSIPYLFTMCEFNKSSYIDGSVMLNYPITYYKNTEDILGFLIISPINDETEINTIDTYTLSLINCIIKRENNFCLQYFKDCTIPINVDISMINFNLSKEEKTKLFNIGYKETEKYLLKFYKKFSYPEDILSKIRDFKKNIDFTFS